MNANIEDMVIVWLTSKGCDGLVNTDIECGCKISDLFPCGEPDFKNCVYGYEHEDGLMYKEKEIK